MIKLLFTLIITTSILLTSYHPNPNPNIQTLTGTVTSIDNEYITFTTSDSNGWAIYYEPGYTVNDNVTITFDTLGTSDIYDDEIISITK